MAVDGGFELSEWFNTVSTRGGGGGGGGRAAPAKAKGKAKVSGKSATSGGHAPEPSVCFVCHIPNPQWTSSDKVKTAPPVPVCSPECETRYLEAKGLQPAGKSSSSSKKRKKEDYYVVLDEDEDMNGDDDLDYEHCFVCERPGPEYMSTNSVKNIPSVPVCGVECEAEHLKRKGRKKGAVASSPAPAAATNKRNKSAAELGATAKSAVVKQSLSFLEDHLLENDDSKGYKSWWLRALTFYDFVYQRHAMWHSYTYTPDKPNVDPALTNFTTWNIYRELDRTTAYLRKSVVRWQKAHQDHRSLREVLWMAVVFRFCNKIETFYDVQGIPRSDEFKAFKKRLLSLIKKKPNTEILAGNRDINVDTYLQTLEDFLERLDASTYSVMNCATVQEVFETLRGFHGNALGSFTCWQVVCDLMELKILPKEIAEDDFIWMTADAKQSLVQIFGKRRARPSEFVSLARMLQQRQTQGFKALRVEFPYFMDQKLNLKNVGHALHGYQLYRDIKLLQYNRFHGEGFGATPPGTYSSRSVLNDQEPCEKCSSDEDDLLLCDLCHRMFHKECANVLEVPPASWVCDDCKTISSYPHVGLVETPAAAAAATAAVTTTKPVAAAAGVSASDPVVISIE